MRHALEDRFLGARRVPEIAFEIGDLGGGNHLRLHILRAKLDAGAEIGVHRALAIGRDEDHRAGGGRKGVLRLRCVMHALGANVVGEDAAQLILGHLAEIGRLATEACDACRRVARAAAGSFDGRSHARIEQFGALGVDEVHRCLGYIVVDEKVFFAPRDDINDRIANRQDVIRGHCQALSMFFRLSYNPADDVGVARQRIGKGEATGYRDLIGRPT